jgi:DHA1 family bicyclomycin/chloramphenicol resistance-like MFS transporter
VSSPSPHHRRSFVVTLGLLTGLAALTVDLSLPAIPAMVEALATNLQRSQQIVGIFMAGMAFGQIPAGLFADRLGRMPVLYVGMSLFATAATIAATANDIEVLLAARFLQGFGAASALVVSRLMSLMMMIFTAAPVIAPSIGALLVAQWGWRTPFTLIAACGFAILLAIRSNLFETHTPTSGQHAVRQLISSFAEFFSHRQSIFGLLLVILPPAGFMSIITVSAALVVEIYGFSLQAFGLVFATAGLSILSGAAVNRILVTRFDMMQLITIAVVLIAISGAQLLVIAWLDGAPFWWLWVNICIFMFTVAILMPNSLVVALDPLPRIAGVASSIIGTLQNVLGASGAIAGALIFDGSVRNSVVIIATVSAITIVVFLLKPLIAPGPFMHHPDELARD